VISRVAALSAGFKRSYAYMLATGQKGGPTWRSISTFGTKNALPNYPARFNIAPTDPVLTVRFNPETKERTLDALRWGLVPHWANDLKLGSRMINARAEMVVTIPAFRDAFKSRRCIIPASGFYEWKQTGGAKQPYAIVPKGEQLFAFAGLWENWRDKAGGESVEWIRTCAIVTGEPDELMAPIHNRMPVILPRKRGVNGWAKSRRAKMICNGCSIRSQPSACALTRSAPGSTA
jgi:putative SOS response-associated peptidase YedK